MRSGCSRASQRPNTLPHECPRTKYFFAFEPSAKVIHYVNRVLLHLRHVHCSVLKLFVVGGVRFPRSALVPLHYGEIFLPRVLKRTCHRNKSNPWSAVNEQKNGIVHILAAHLDPLIDTADSNGLEAVDSVG